ncbi:tRNA-dihydrouridine(20) synthase [NAD(P)+]-like protein [Bonamia ostreae]|uniref:tRNA-dihydrouridine(20) synthase [NAD(P)+]-like protein n=1 Tax=Bonamia ostreae TaxID=126728 RepID=A0ABV2ALT2_9EUKA
MIARGALWNPSVFDKNGFSPLSDVVPMYARIAMLSNHRWSYTKYCLTTMLKGSKINCESFKLLLSAKSLDDLEPFLVELEKEALSSKTGYDWKKGCKGVKTSFFYLDSLNKKIKYEDLKFD